jgi:hypothetical protein
MRRGNVAIKRWVMNSKRKTQKGGFLGLITAGLIALGMSAGTAATTAAVAAPIVSGAVSGAASYGMSKALGGGKRRKGGFYNLKRKKPILSGRVLRIR